jgi:hypothetical protein
MAQSRKELTITSSAVHTSVLHRISAAPSEGTLEREIAHLFHLSVLSMSQGKVAGVLRLPVRRNAAIALVVLERRETLETVAFHCGSLRLSELDDVLQ